VKPASAFIATLATLLSSHAFAAQAEVRVHDADSFRSAVAAARPGTRILLEGGVYGGGFHFAGVRGEPGKPIIIAAADPGRPPVFRDANVGLHFSSPAYLELHNLVLTGLAHNGLNIDDAGASADSADAHHVTLRGLRIHDIGADGNHDAIKLSGVQDFAIIDCTLERWGTRGGSAIDLVGCHRGLIDSNLIRHNVPAPPNCNGVQAKGGSTDIVIRANRFEHAGGRAVNLGGSTGRAYFRPALVPGGEHAEARDLIVEGNTFIGGITPVAFVGVDGAIVRFNTIERPARWTLRILQANTAAGFVPSRRGQFIDNVIVFEAARSPGGSVNVGAGTAPETFSFARNWWYNVDAPGRSRPALPTPEQDGVYGRDPTEAGTTAGAGALPP